LVGRGTASADDPLLTARPPGARSQTRIVLDSRASLALDSQLVRTAAEAPVLVAVSASAPGDKCRELRARGVAVWQSAAADRNARLSDLLDELGRRQMTNVLVEGGAGVFGALFELNAVDEVHVFVAPRIVGGTDAKSPVGGRGIAAMASAVRLVRCKVQQCGEDAYMYGRVPRSAAAKAQE
jgi:diaminohydroxyphosphoribosylaminopyrimidine deaminase/5-amino-6-(5-phosphoribosylamino)uracil reductase